MGPIMNSAAPSIHGVMKTYAAARPRTRGLPARSGGATAGEPDAGGASVIVATGVSPSRLRFAVRHRRTRRRITLERVASFAFELQLSRSDSSKSASFRGSVVETVEAT